MNLKVVENVRRIDNNKFVGTIPVDGKMDVEVSREQAGWQIVLVIKIDGGLFHKDVPTPKETLQFDEIMEQAFQLQFNEEEARSERRRWAGKEMFLRI